ncbi:MAG: DNA repair protein RecO [Pyrinomonadaceae bacterium]
MALYETEAIVLRSYNLAEADRIVVFLTRDHGVVRGVAKGVKRLGSRFGGILEPFTIVDLTFFQKESLELVSIRNVDLVRSNFAAVTDPPFLQKFSYLVEILLAFTPPHDPNETLYRMVNACVAAGTELPNKLVAICLYFEFWLLRLGGYLPDWSTCDRCARVFAPDETATFEGNSHLSCETCRRGTHHRNVSAAQREIFRAGLTLSPADFALAVSSEKDAVELSALIKEMISKVLGREIRKEKVLL